MRPLRFTPWLVLCSLAACGGQAETGLRRSDAAPLLAAISAGGPGVAELRGGRIREARARFEEALARDPDGLGALNDLAVSYAVEERFEAARQLLDEVVARGAPRDQQRALVNLGELHALEGYLSAARAHFESARDIDPAWPEPVYALALLEDVRGNPAAALAFLREAQRLDEAGAARRGLAFLHPEERVHLGALAAEAQGDAALAAERWRQLEAGRFPALAQAARRHLGEP